MKARVEMWKTFAEDIIKFYFINPRNKAKYYEWEFYNHLMHSHMHLGNKDDCNNNFEYLERSMFFRIKGNLFIFNRGDYESKD
jgi:hypothetical protein